MKTLAQTILPRIALHKCLSEEGFSEEDVYKYMRKYMLDKVAAKKHASTAKMELVPGFYAIYSNIFLKIMRTTDLQESTQAYGNDYYDVTIKKCLWHTACVENGFECADTGISGTDAYGGSRNRNRCGNECASCKNSWRGKKQKSCESRRKQSVFRCDNLCGMSVVWHFWSEGIHFITDG